MCKGFTLIELLVVVLIISILSAVAMPQYLKATERARATEAISILSSIAKAEKMYQTLRTTFTDNLEMLDFSTPVTFSNNPTAVTTQYFTFEVVNVTASTLLMTARRSENSIPLKGKDAYMINMAIRSGGQVITWCLPGSNIPQEIPASVSDIEVLSGKGDNVKMCRAVSDGDDRGIIR